MKKNKRNAFYLSRFYSNIKYKYFTKYQEKRKIAYEIKKYSRFERDHRFQQVRGTGTGQGQRTLRGKVCKDGAPSY